MIFLWIALSITIMSFIEYASHRWLMHNNKFKWTRLWFFNKIYNEHKFLHHRLYYKKFDNEPNQYGRELNIELGLTVNISIMVAILIPVAFVSLGFALTMLWVLITHHLIWNTIHREMHIPSGSWFSKTRVFKWLARYHYLHHRYPGKNFQVVIPIFDYLLGTHINPLPRDVEKMKEMGLYAEKT